MDRYAGVDKFADMLIPRGCVLCSTPMNTGALLCKDCIPERLTGPLCPRCGKPERSCVCAPYSDDEWAARGMLGALAHRGKVRGTVLRLRRMPDHRLVRFFAQEMAMALEREYTGAFAEVAGRSDVRDLPKFDIITEVPRHVEKLERRGFNQAELLAGALAPMVGAAHRMRILACLREQSVAVSGHQKFAAAQESYALQIPIVAGKDVLLIDDVLDTGATANACAAHLLGGGAASVFVLTATTTVNNQRQENSEQIYQEPGDTPVDLRDMISGL